MTDGFKKVLKTLLSKLENGQSVENCINLRICVSEISKIWQNKVSETVKNCFTEAGFLDEPIQKQFKIIQKCWD